MSEQMNRREQAEHGSGLCTGLAVGLVLLVGLIVLSGCGKNSASGKDASAGTVVKNSSGMEFAYVPAGGFQMGSGNAIQTNSPFIK